MRASSLARVASHHTRRRLREATAEALASLPVDRGECVQVAAGVRDRPEDDRACSEPDAAPSSDRGRATCRTMPIHSDSWSLAFGLPGRWSIGRRRERHRAGRLEPQRAELDRARSTRAPSPPVSVKGPRIPRPRRCAVAELDVSPPGRTAGGRRHGAPAADRPRPRDPAARAARCATRLRRARSSTKRPAVAGAAAPAFGQPHAQTPEQACGTGEEAQKPSRSTPASSAGHPGSRPSRRRRVGSGRSRRTRLAAHSSVE